MKKIFTQFFLFAIFCVASLNLNAQTFYVLNAPDEVTQEYSVLWQERIYEPAALSGPGAKLSFELSKSANTAVGDTEVQQYVNGEWKNIATVMPSGRNEFNSYSYDLDLNATKIRFYNGYGSYKRTYRNVKVTMASYSKAPADSVWTAPAAEAGEPQEAASTTMEWCNVAPFELSLTGEGASAFSVSIENNAELGKVGTATLSATYSHDAVGEHSAVLTISNGTSTYSINLYGTTAIKRQSPEIASLPTVAPLAYGEYLNDAMLSGGEVNVEGTFEWNTDVTTLLIPGEYQLPIRFVPADGDLYYSVDTLVSVVVNKSTQSIVWNNTFENITVVDSIILNASAQTEITYEASDMELAYITENNVLYFLHGGTLLITAYAVENEYYLADTLVRELTILPSKPTILSWPTASDIVYGQSLGESVLTGGEATIEGTFDWVDPNEVFGAGIYAPYVRFTPDDLVSFKIVEQQVQIQINSAEQTIEWELTNLVIKLGDTLHLNATATSGLEIAYALDNDMYAKIEGNVLEALQVGTVVVTASQDGIYVDDFGDEYANYLPAEPVSYTITIVANDATTALEDVQSTISRARKIIRNGQMYIIRGEQTYDALGNLIR